MSLETQWSQFRATLQEPANLKTAAVLSEILLQEEKDLELMVGYLREHARPLLRIMVFGVVQMTTQATPLASQKDGATATAEKAAHILSLLTRPRQTSF